MEDKKQSAEGRFIRTFLITVVIVTVFAYGFEVTDIDLEEPKQERRQSQLVNVIRALARPDLVQYETERIEVNAPILVPCPEGEVSLPDLSQPDGVSVQLSEACAEPRSEITVTGSGFDPGAEALIFFVPYKEDVADEVQLPLANRPVVVDSQGEFETTVELRSGRTSENPQQVRVVVNRRTSLPQPSAAVYETIEKIIETIFLALIATALGTALSIPVSFLAARNLMIQVSSLFGSLMTLVAVAPIGWLLGWWLFGLIGGWGAELITSGEVPAVAFLWVPALLFSSLQAVGSRDSRSLQAALVRNYGLGLLIALLAALAVGLIGGVGQVAGLGLTNILGPFAFLGNFLYVISDALVILLPFIGGLIGMSAAVSLAGGLSESLLRHLNSAVLSKGFTVVMAVLAGMVLVGVPALFLAWLYEFSNRWMSVGAPALMGGIILGIASLFMPADRPMPTGLIIYYVTRTVLNVLRAIEPLIMAIVFVVWVGIGPFAGVLALTLHTIASLGKLYSEQVENISQGPIEAITATGATRLQTIIYAVIPQIVPPYIAFTIYRWDINVRMSTIIGFAGGGGIGFLLQQNLNLLKYRQASVQMLAIAIVVASLDYISAKIRERII